jgi:hypothetical protein
MVAHATIGINCYGFDIDETGALGPGTIRRLHYALSLHDAVPGSELFVSAGLPRDRGNQTDTMAALQAAWLERNGARSVHIGAAATPDTWGEMRAFQDVGYETEYHHSDWWHLPRIRTLRRSIKSSHQPEVHFAAVPFLLDDLPLRAMLEEVPKYLIVRYAPRLEQPAARVRNSLQRKP